MSVVEAIRSAVPVLVHTRKISKESQSALHEMIKQVDSAFLQIERLYMMQCLANELQKLSSQEAAEFFIKMFPAPLPPYVTSFLSHLLAMAISLSFTSVLNSSSLLLEAEILDFPPTVGEISPDLALASPQFAAVVLSKGHFLEKNIFTPEIISQWVQTLNKVDADSFSPFDVHHLIKYSLLGSGSSSLALHLGILSSIELKRIQPLSWNQIGDISKSLSGSTDNILKERFLQIVLVARQAGKLEHEPPKEIKERLLSDFPENPLVKFMLKT